MNKTMTAMMKPIPTPAHSNRTELRRRQEEHILTWLEMYPSSVNRHDVAEKCHNIPGVNDADATRYMRCNAARACSNILKRLEKKGHVISVLCNDGYRYYSIPVENGGDK